MINITSKKTKPKFSRLDENNQNNTNFDYSNDDNEINDTSYNNHSFDKDPIDYTELIGRDYDSYRKYIDNIENDIFEEYDDYSFEEYPDNYQIELNNKLKI